jgi:hypothetical protein
MKEGLFCFVLYCIVVMRFSELGCFRSCSWCLWKALNKKGCMGFGSMVFGLVVQKLLNIEWLLYWELNYKCSYKFQRNWNVPLVLLERSWWAGFNGIYLVRFGFRMKIQIHFKKPSFGRKKSVKEVVTLGPNSTGYTNYSWRFNIFLHKF